MAHRYHPDRTGRREDRVVLPCTAVRIQLAPFGLAPLVPAVAVAPRASGRRTGDSR